MEVDRAAAHDRYDRALGRAGAFLRGMQRRDGSTAGAGSVWGYYSQPLALLSGGSPEDWSWLLFDLEHGPLTIESLQRLLQSMNGSRAAALVRTPPGQPSLAGRVLDCGADGVVFPMIDDRSQAQAAVDACRYPPLGSRGMGPRRAAGYGRIETEYLRSANDRTVVAIQIETGGGVERIDEILSVAGIDAALLGLETRF